MNMEVKFLAHFFEIRNGSLPAPAKRIIKTDDNFPGPDETGKNVFGKVPGLLVGKLLGEMCADDRVDAAPFDQFHFLAKAGQQGRDSFGRDDF